MPSRHCCLMYDHGAQPVDHHQTNAEAAVQMVPEMVKLLQDEDQEVVAKTAGFIHGLSQNDANRSILVNDARLVTALVAAMDAGGMFSDVMVDLTVRILYTLSKQHDGWTTMYHSRGVPFLLKILGYHKELVVNRAVTTLHNLIDVSGLVAKNEIIRHGGVTALLPLLEWIKAPVVDPKFVNIVCDCLKHLAIGNQEVKMMIHGAGGPVLLLQCVELGYQHEKVVNAALSVLKAISVEDENKRTILKEKGIEILVRCAHRCCAYRTSRDRVLTSVLYVLRNLSDMLVTDPEFSSSNMNGLLELLVALLRREEPESSRLDPIVLCSTGILSNLTCNNQHNQLRFYQLEGIPLLLSVCNRYPKKEEITEPAMCTLRHITGCHDQSGEIKAQFCDFGKLKILIGLLKQKENRWTLIKAIIGVIQNLVLDQNVRGLFRSATDHHRSYTDIVQYHQSVQVDCVRMHDVMGCLTGALHSLAVDPPARAMIRSAPTARALPSVVNILVQLIPFPAENVQRAVAGILSELAHDPEGAQMLESSGALSELSEVLNRPRGSTAADAIAAYAAADAMRHIIAQKSGQSRPQVEQYLQQNPSVPPHGLWPGNDMATAQYDDMMPVDSFHHFHSSGPPSLHGSVHSSLQGNNLSVYDQKEFS